MSSSSNRPVSLREDGVGVVSFRLGEYNGGCGQLKVLVYIVLFMKIYVAYHYKNLSWLSFPTSHSNIIMSEKKKVSMGWTT